MYLDVKSSDLVGREISASVSDAIARLAEKQIASENAFEDHASTTVTSGADVIPDYEFLSVPVVENQTLS